MTRAEFQQMAPERLLDAEALLAMGRWSGAYYLAGYAVECALKACVAKLTNQYDFPDRERALKSYTHKLEALVDVAGLKQTRDRGVTANPTLDKNWKVAKEWDEQSRYQLWTEGQARDLFDAISDPANGVYPWITARW